MKAQGFSLLELALVLVVMGVLAAGVVTPLLSYQQHQDIQETHKQLEQIQQALVGFALRQGRLPCPDTNADGREDNANGSCNVSPISALASRREQHRVVAGFLPYRDLAIANTDRYGQAYQYAVSVHYADSLMDAALSPPDPTPFPGSRDMPCSPAQTQTLPAPSFSMCSAGGIVVRERDRRVLADNLPFIVFSRGRYTRSRDEQENLDGDRQFVQGELTPQQATDYFDDVLLWLPPQTLALLMLQAGRLP